MITLTAKIFFNDGSVSDIKHKNLKHLESKIITYGDTTQPSWGIISNRGTLRFVNDELAQKIVNTPSLIKNSRVDIFLVNTLKNSSCECGKFKISSWSYDNNTREVTISLSDDLEEWQEISIRNYYLVSEKTAYDIYENYLKEETPDKWEFEPLDKTTRSVLENYIIKYPFFKKDNLWAQFYKLCTACGLTIFKNSKGKVVVSYALKG